MKPVRRLLTNLQGNRIVAVLIHHLEKSYQHPVLKGISLDVPKGQILGVIGRSGAGKSTLLRCLNGLETPDKGTISIDNESFVNIPPSKKRKIQQKIGNVFQSFNLMSRLTVSENILFPLKLTKSNVQNAHAKAQKLIKLVGLEGKENAYPRELSGGQAQRVAIARALITDASLLLCDEFTSALDYETSLDILELLRNLNKQLGLTIILITHDMAIVREICDEVCVLDDGKIVEKNDITSILLHPKHMVTKKLIRNLIVKDLPHHLQENLLSKPKAETSVLIRLFYSSRTAGEPIIASLVKKYDVPVNILVGNLDHIRETAFGSLIISVPYDKEVLDKMVNDLDAKDISSEVIGYLPKSGDHAWNS